MRQIEDEVRLSPCLNITVKGCRGEGWEQRLEFVKLAKKLVEDNIARLLDNQDIGSDDIMMISGTELESIEEY